MRNSISLQTLKMKKPLNFYMKFTCTEFIYSCFGAEAFLEHIPWFWRKISFKVEFYTMKIAWKTIGVPTEIFALCQRFHYT